MKFSKFNLSPLILNLTLTLVFFVLFSASVFADESYKKNRVYYSNVEKELGFLPDEIFSLVSSAEFEFFSLESLPVEIKEEKAFAPSKKNLKIGFKLPDFSNISKGQVINFVNALNEQQSFFNKNLILYKINSRNLNLGLVKSIKKVRVFSENKPMVKIRASINTFYPSHFNNEDETVQLYRRKLEFIEPKEYKGYKLLHYNFLSSDEDAFSLYSPITKNKRTLSETILYDYFFNVDLKFKDFFNFYLKPSKMEVLYVKNKELYGAFKSPYLVNANSSSSGCQSVENYKKVWNVDTKKFPGAKEYLLSNVYFTKREVLEVGAVIKDVFSSVKKRVFYIDQELGIVLFESSYDDEDNLISYKLPVYMFFNHNFKNKPFEVHSLVFDAKRKAYALSDNEYLSFCSDEDVINNKDHVADIHSLSISNF